MSEQSEANAEGMSFVEKHLQTMIMAALGAVCGWMALTTQGLTISVATLTEKVSNLQESVKEERGSLYTRTDADRDLALRDQVITNIASRVLALEQGVKK